MIENRFPKKDGTGSAVPENWFGSNRFPAPVPEGNNGARGTGFPTLAAELGTGSRWEPPGGLK